MMNINAQIIDVTQIEASDKVIFGTTVNMMNLKTEQEVTYKIVGEDEADIKQAKISFSSPIARALIGKFVGDTVDVHTPDGVISYEIIDVAYI
jgi:transcription elongation factor GreA